MKYSLSIVASFTAEPVGDPLQFLFARLGFEVDVSFAPYGQLFQAMLRPDSEFHQRQSGWNVALLRVDDLLSGADANTRSDKAKQPTTASTLCQDFGHALDIYANSSNVPLLLIVTPSANTEETPGAEFERLLSLKVSELPSVFLIGSEHLQDLYPVKNIFDAEADRFGHVPYTDSFFAAIASCLTRTVITLSRPEKKVVVVDCDNTLWKGVCGEDGSRGVSVSGSYRFLQSTLLKQFDSGRLICLVSKNIESDVKAVFDDNPQMLLSWDKLTTWKINWSPKSENLKSLARELDLGLDSMIFIDDNPVEIAEVKANCPEVLAIQLPADEAEFSSLLNHIWALDKLQVTAEDKLRTKSYRDNAKRNQLQSASASFESFLKSLDLRIDIGELPLESIPRTAQLSQRTNQFNTTGRKFQESDLAKICSHDSRACYTLAVSDRFGDYGLVGAMITEIAGDKFVVTDLMLSCRALGKGVEHKMLAHAGKVARENQLNRVEINFVPTDRNDPAQRFLESLDCERTVNSGMTRFLIDADLLSDLQMKLPLVANKNEPAGKPDAESDHPAITPAPAARHSMIEQPDYRIFETGLFCRDAENIVNALGEKLEHRPDIQQSFSEPKEGFETMLASIWQRVLRIGRIGRNDRFVDLGGNSVMLVRIHSLILERLHVDVPITALFKYATISALAGYLESDRKTDSRMLAARERALRGRSVNRATFKRNTRRANG